METGKRFKKDELFKEAQSEFSVKLDRRLSLEQLEDQIARLRQHGKEPAESEKKQPVPKRVRNVITGNIFDYNPIWKGLPDLEVIEWED